MSLIFIIIFIYLLVRVHNLKKALENRNKKSNLYNQQRQAEEALKNTIEHDLRQTPRLFYLRKNSCMTANESRMFFYINKALEELIPDPIERSYYYVFPQVCLYSFIRLHPKLEELSSDIARSNYIAKSIDFVICYCNRQSYSPDGSAKQYTYYAYTPVVLIELDGQSHFSPTQFGVKAFEHQQANDQFKNALFRDLNIPFIRYHLTNQQIYSDDGIFIKQKIKEALRL